MHKYHILFLCRISIDFLYSKVYNIIVIAVKIESDINCKLQKIKKSTLFLQYMTM